MADEEARRKAEEREAKKAEVRKRLEEQGKKGKTKKGFLTPERKKKLRKLLMMKAAEDLKQQQLKKEQERQKALADRVVPLPDIDTLEDHGKLESIYNDLWARVCALEDSKYDVLQLVKDADQTINQLTIEVNDLRGKYVKPSLKKVSKFDNKFKKMAQQAAPAEKLDFRSNLKVVRNTQTVDEIMEKKKKDDKPDWTKGGAVEKKEEKKEEESAPAVQEAEPAAEEAAEEPAPEADEEEGEEEGEDEEEEE